ncbi:MAG: PIN domain-containing protein [Cyclobacterium sp.]|uniref:PIN domain-containing protein n=1 Tax=Cyclobacterium sp. TaxID=1966343 RepID=UPI0039707D18
MRGVVFDTSIWIEYLKGNPKYFNVCQELLENGRVFGLELIFAELLQGAKSKREVNVILEYASLVPTLDEPFLVMESGFLSYHSGLVHHGVGIIDAVIFNAVQKNELQLWTLDKKLKQVVGYDLLFNP